MLLGFLDGAMMTQSSICYGTPKIFKADEMHMSVEGADIYLANMNAVIKAALKQFRWG